MAMEVGQRAAHIAADEAQIELLLSEKLMDGYVLLEKSCPVCSTPLVKKSDDGDEGGKAHHFSPIMVPSGKFEAPFNPVEGVPFCVGCTSHVITQESDISILERCDSLKNKGSILVALQDTSTGVSGSQYTSLSENSMPSTKDSSTHQEATHVIDLTDHTEPSVVSREHSDEKKEEEHISAPASSYYLTDKEEDEDNAEDMVAEYSVRREIATKVLGAKMLQGYTLKETQCNKCGMPQMEWQGKLDCVVCPALVKKAKKMAKAQQKLDEESGRLVREIEVAKQGHKLEAENARIALEAEEKRLLEEARRVPKNMTEEYQAAEEKRRHEDLALLQETKRLEAMEERSRYGMSSTSVNMKKDLLSQQHRQRLAEKAKLDKDILMLEQGRLNEELEARKVVEQKRAEEEARMIELLEDEAAEKAKTAQNAILKAKAALEHVHSARRDIIAQTIAMAEAEAIQEAEDIIKAEREDYRAPVLIQSESSLQKERWETLRTEGRSVMTRRVMAGWILLSELCRGTECENSPLVIKDNKKECVVCGGCGNGKDGVYALTAMSADDEDDDETTLYDSSIGFKKEYASGVGSVSTYTIKELHDDFETKRDMVSKEIGKRMLQGWTLMDASCPHCVMPLMMDSKGRPDICVLCGLMKTIQSNAPLVHVPSAEETAPVSARGDATTVNSTLPSRAHDLPSAPTMARPDPIQLADSIRQQVIKKALISPMGDPPASLKKLSRDAERTPGQITVNYRDDVSRMTGRNDTDLPRSAVEIAKLFLESPLGYETLQKGTQSLNADELRGLVDFYVATFLKQSLSDGIKRDIVSEIIKSAKQVSPRKTTTGPQPLDIIHLEEMPSPDPRAFNFNGMDNEGTFTSKTSREKIRPTPENMSARGGRNRFGQVPPRPDGARRVPRPSPRSCHTPKQGVHIVGGPADFQRRRGGSVSGDSVSRAGTVASETMDSILSRIEDCKAMLMDPDVDVETQAETANLIEKLAKAAVAVRKMEELDF